MLNSFDLKALSWDDNPVVLERSKAIASLILKELPDGVGGTALEAGAGSGQLSVLLKDHFDQITMVDSSPGMVRVMREKIERLGITNLSPELFDLEKDTPAGSFDAVFNQMLLHHVEDIGKLLEKFYALLKKDGLLALADLYTENGTFHNDSSNIHPGFDPARLAETLKAAGFRDTFFRCCYVIKKPDQQQEEALYPVFLLTARK